MSLSCEQYDEVHVNCALQRFVRAAARKKWASRKSREAFEKLFSVSLYGFESIDSNGVVGEFYCIFYDFEEERGG